MIQGILEEFKQQFDRARQQPGMKPNVPPWNFNPSAVFHRLDAFLKRLADIEWLFNTVLEFSKLEKIEVGGILGRSLSARIVGVSKEFQQLFASFSARASDVLEPDDESFAVDCAKFSESITDLDSKLAAILCQAFDDCGNLESAFKVRTSFYFINFYPFYFFLILFSLLQRNTANILGLLSTKLSSTQNKKIH